MNASCSDSSIRSDDRATWPEVASLIEVGNEFHRRGWSLATSSNYSAVLDRDPFRLLVTASGRDKSRLTPDDFVVIDELGLPTEGESRPSAEAHLHLAAAVRPEIGAVLHTHSVWGTLLSDVFHEQGVLELHGYEMIKGLEGVVTHDHTLRIPIFENTQDIPSLAVMVRDYFTSPEGPYFYGFLIRRHGLYTWGRDLQDARRHVEALEFLFEVRGRGLSMHSPLPRALPQKPSNSEQK